VVHIRTSIIALALIGWAGAAAAQCEAPKPFHFQIDRKITRSALGFTQGLLFRDGRLYESTGRIDGTSQLNVIDLSGKVTNLVDLGTTVFGEGLTILGNEFIQLTWQDHLVFAYDLKGKLLRQMSNPREGWGLTDDGKELIFSDGGEAIYFADPKTFTIKKSVKIVWRGAKPVLGLNELEMVHGKIYGNIFTTRRIVRLDPQTGCIDRYADLGVLWQAMTAAERKHIASNRNYVLNGIAYDAAADRFFLTGKRWNSIFVGRFLDGR
jgi:glutaminyl-peptide cyclotransferase